MAERKYYIGSLGPFLYDDTDLIEDQDGDFPAESYDGFVTSGGVRVGKNPSDDHDVVRKEDLGRLNIEYFTATGTITSTKSIVYADGTFDLFLPTVANGLYRFYEIKNEGTGIVTLKANASEPTVELEGERYQPLYPGDSFTKFTDGTDWRII